MADNDQISGKVVIEIAEAQNALQQVATTLQQTNQIMVDGFKQMTDQSARSSQQVKQEVEKMGSGVTSAIKDMHGQVTEAFDQIGSVITKVSGIIAGVGAVLAGGALFKGAVEQFVEMNLEAKRLSGVLGTNIQDAAAFIEAYKRVGVNSDTVGQSLRMLERNMHTNGDTIIATAEKVGVHISAQDSLKDTYFKVIDALGKYKEGHDRNQAALDMLGARVQNVNSLLRVHSEQVEEASQRLRSLGLNFDDISVDKARKYKEGLADVNLQYDAMKYKIGEVAIPALTSLGKVFIWVTERIKDMMTSALSAEGAIATLGGYGPHEGPKLTYPSQKPGEKTGASYTPIDKGGAGSGGGSIVQQWQAELDQLKAADKAYQDQSLQIEKDFLQKHLEAGRTATKEELDNLKAKMREAQALQLQAEKDFWTKRLAETSEGTKEYQEVFKKILTADQNINKQRLQSEIETIKGKIEANQASLKDYENLITQQQKLRNLDLQREQEGLKHQQKMGQLSKTQELQQYRQFLIQKQQQDIKEQTDLLAKYKGDEKNYQAHLEKLEVLKKQYALDVQKVDDQIEEQGGKAWDTMISGAGTAFSQFSTSIMNGSQNMLTSLQGIFSTMEQTFVKAVEEMIAEWLGFESLMAAFKAGIGGIFGGFFHGGGEVMHGGGQVAHAGAIVAHGGLAADEVPVIAQRGEWIINRQAAWGLERQIGPGAFNLLNSGKLPALATPVAAGAAGSTPPIIININAIDTKSILDHRETLAKAVNQVLDRHGKALLGKTYK